MGATPLCRNWRERSGGNCGRSLCGEGIALISKGRREVCCSQVFTVRAKNFVLRGIKSTIEIRYTVLRSHNPVHIRLSGLHVKSPSRGTTLGLCSSGLFVSEGKLKMLEMVDISAPQVVYKGNIFNECTEVTRLHLKIEDYNFNDILYNFKKLEELHINISKNCMTPESGPFLIKGFMRLTSLKVLRMDGWPIADEDEVILDINKLVIPGATDFLPQLEVLEIRKCRRLEKVHFEKRALQSLCILKISDCGCLAHVVGLQHLLQLRELVISNLPDFEEGLVTTSDDDGNGSLSDVQTHSASFPNLQRLRLESLRGMKHICNDNVSFPSLSEFTLYDCPMLGKLPRGLMNENRSTPMISGKIEGREEWWNGLEWEDNAFEAYLRPLFVVN